MTLAEHVERYVTFPLPRMELAPGVESIQSASRSRAAEPARPTTAPRDTTRAAASPIALRDGPRQRGLSLYAAPGAADSGSHGDFERIPVLCPGPASDRNARLDRYNSTCRRFNGDLTWELPIAATYVVGRDGVVAWAGVDVDYTRRPEPGELLGVLDGMG